MQKITQYLGEHLKPVKLYLDDTEQIIEIFRQDSLEVSISTKDYVLNDFKELSDLKKDFITDVFIRVKEPYISLSLEHHQIWLYAEKDNAISRGLFEKVKQLLSKRKRPLAQFLQSSLLTGLFAGTSIPLLTMGLAKTNSMLIFVSAIIFILALASGWYSYHDHFERYSIIIPKYKIEAPSFWKRNSDALVLAIFSAIAGGIITLILAKFFNFMP
jgi:hypothetical protein